MEKFNDHWGAKLQRRVDMTTAADLARESPAFETRHNLTWRYSGLAGQTPMQALAAMQAKLRFPSSATPPPEPLPKPTRGRYHIVRFIRSDGRMDQVVKTMKTIGAANAVTSSDAGTPTKPMPPETLAPYLYSLMVKGISKEDIRLMSAENPARLLNLA